MRACPISTTQDQKRTWSSAGSGPKSVVFGFELSSVVPNVQRIKKKMRSKESLISLLDCDKQIGRGREDLNLRPRVRNQVHWLRPAVTTHPARNPPQYAILDLARTVPWKVVWSYFVCVGWKGDRFGLEPPSRMRPQGQLTQSPRISTKPPSILERCTFGCISPM